MEPKPLRDIAGWIDAEYRGLATAEIGSVSTDTRSLAPGSLFIALRGERFDGHQFLERARAGGAVAALVEQADPALADFPQLVVPDTLAALQQLAREYRRTLPLRVVGITGSNGKTSTKEMVAAILARRFRVHKTSGNLNNHIGVPLSVLGADSRHEFAVLEYGMNHAGEIARLISIVRPDHALITNIGVAHIEFLGSRQAIATEKSTLIQDLPPDGVAVLPAGDDFSKYLLSRARGRTVLAGYRCGDVQVDQVEPVELGVRFRLRDGAEEVAVNLPVPGEHMAVNAALAAALARSLGVSLQDCADGLRELTLPGDRLRVTSLDGITVLNDAYNANPDSMIAALKTGRQIPVRGRRVAALGSMGELGAESAPGHERVGVAAAQLGYDFLITVGVAAQGILHAARRTGLANAVEAGSPAEAALVLRDYLEPGDLLLVKGSRSAAMDRVLGELEGWRKGGYGGQR